MHEQTDKEDKVTADQAQMELQEKKNGQFFFAMVRMQNQSEKLWPDEKENNEGGKRQKEMNVAKFFLSASMDIEKNNGHN